MAEPLTARPRTEAALDEDERELLAFEAAHPRHSARKDDAIRRRFGRSSAQYYQLLGALIERPAALAYDPVLVSRLRRVREARAQLRETRRQQRQEHDPRHGQAGRRA